MTPFGFIVGFAPWIVFSVAAHRLAGNAVAWAALIAAAMAAVALLVARRRHGPVILNAASLVLFGAIAVIGFVGGPPVDQWLYTWGRPLVGVVLGLYLLVTAPVRPFTEEYARQSTPRQYWGSPTFRKINLVLSAAWGGALAIIGAAGLLVTALADLATDNSADHLADLLLNWIVPILIIWGMIKFTAVYPARVSGASESVPPGSAGSRDRGMST
jgi:hypothetical protein